MQFSYSQPLDQAWQRMTALLFRPFDLGRWFVLGFTAWLAQLATGYSGGASEKIRISDDWDEPTFDSWFSGVEDYVRAFFDHTWAFLLVGMVLLVGLVVWLVVLWLSSRGQFMFLDNLVHRRTEVKAPWSSFRNQGDSLFLWQVVYTLIFFVVFGALVTGGILFFLPLAALDSPPAAVLPLAVLAGTTGFILIVTAIYIEFFLTQFVVPIMYKHRISATEAWGRFLPLFRENPGGFVVYGLLYFFLMLIGWILFFVGGAVTCCIGLVLLVLPYIGTVVSLPLHTFGRYFSLDYLGQYGDDFRVLERWPEKPDHPYGSESGPATGPAIDSGNFQGDGTVVGPQDLGPDTGADKPGPEDS